MSNIYIGVTPYDTNTSCEIVSEINELEAIERRLRHLITSKTDALLQRYREELLAQRPNYPTPKQRELIELIAESVHAGNGTGDIATGPVTFSSHQSLINIYAQAPHNPQTISRMWEIQSEEIAAVRVLLHKNSLRVLDEWPHEDGHGFVVASKKV